MLGVCLKKDTGTRAVGKSVGVLLLWWWSAVLLVLPPWAWYNDFIAAGDTRHLALVVGELGPCRRSGAAHNRRFNEEQSRTASEAAGRVGRRARWSLPST